MIIAKAAHEAGDNVIGAGRRPQIPAAG